MTNGQTRRALLRSACCLLPAAAVPGISLASQAAPRHLSFYHCHTSEQLDVVYRDADGYVGAGVSAVNHLLRDFRSGEVHEMDLQLLDLLHEVQSLTGGRAFEVISGYRSPATNAMLRNKSNGVAKRSLHMQGRAIDVRLQGVRTADLRKAALELQSGGVGYYPKSDFVHLDTGRVRFW